MIEHADLLANIQMEPTRPTACAIVSLGAQLIWNVSPQD
jgi:hypothetical protein